MGRSCAVLDCNWHSTIALHKVPSGSKTENSWLKFLGAANAKYMWKPTENMYVCSQHFIPKYKMTGSAGKTKISKNGFPTLINQESILQMENEEALYEDKPCHTSNQSSSERILELEAQLLERDDKIHQLETKLDYLKSELRRCRDQLKVTSKHFSRVQASSKRKIEIVEEKLAKNTKLNKDGIMAVLEKRIESPILLAIIQRAIMEKTGNAPYCDVLKEFSFKLHYYSGKGYEVLRSGISNVLPSLRSLNRWTDHVKVQPGFLKESLEFLRKTNAQASNKMYYALTVDEIHIRKQIIHKDDGFIGYVDYGGITEVEECNKKTMATAALFVLATSINGKHKVPICYLLTSGLKANVLANVLRASLTQMKSTNSIVLSVTFDGLPSNFKAMDQLGANMNIHDDEFRPYLTIENSLLKVNAAPDVCHMMKLLRNLFKKFGVMKNYRGQSIKWIFIHRLQKLQGREGLKAGNKLSQRHVNFELEKMKTKLCLQVMSNSVAVAIRVCRILQIDGFEDSEATEEFLLFMNRFFDMMNSKTTGVGFKAPLCQAKINETMPFLAMMKYYLLNLKVNQAGKEVYLAETHKGTAIKGLVCAIHGAENLLKDVVGQDNHDLRYLPMYKLSQDKIELFFSIIRSRLGRNDNPNALQLSQCIKKILCMKAKCVVEGNCLEQEADEGVRICAFRNITAILDEDENCIYDEPSCDLEEELPDLSSFSENVVAYISGYVGRKLCRSLSCVNCIFNIFPDDDDVEKMKDDCILLMEKDHGGLFYPSYFLLSVCKLAEQFTRRHESYGLHKLSKDVLVDRIVLAFSVNFNHLWRCTTECSDCGHLSCLIRQISTEYVKIRLHHSAKQSTMEINPTSTRNFNTRMYMLKGV